MKDYKFNTLEMEIAISKMFGLNQNLIVPNVFWGLFSHECDLISLSKASYCTEIEIKISKADLKKDQKKTHSHMDYEKKIKYLDFAIPEHLENCVDLIPKNAGIIIVWKRGKYIGATRKRRPKKQSDYKFSDKQRVKLLKLSALRIWKLKEKLGGSEEKIFINEDFFHE